LVRIPTERDLKIYSNDSLSLKKEYVNSMVKSLDINSIKTALNNDQFVFFYQPKVSFVSGKIVGAEALIRWKYNDDTIIQPENFIPLAESTGLITEITTTMFPKLLNDLQKLRPLSDTFQVAFNISAKDLKSSHLLLSLREAISTGLLNPSEIQFEITESAIIQGEEQIKKTLTGLVASGVAIAMDDFGTGYASLDVLSRLKFDIIKIDQGLIKRFQFSGKNDIILRTNIAMASFLGTKTVVEGIETADMYYSMQQSGCHECQGYYISPPVPLNDLANLIKSNPTWPASTAGILKMAIFEHSWYQKLIYDWLFIPNKNSKQSHIEAERLRNNDALCLFRMWESENEQYYHGHEYFDALRNKHKELHEIYNRTINSMIHGTSQETMNKLLDRLNESYSKFTERGMKFVQHLLAK